MTLWMDSRVGNEIGIGLEEAGPPVVELPSTDSFGAKQNRMRGGGTTVFGPDLKVLSPSVTAVASF